MFEGEEDKRKKVCAHRMHNVLHPTWNSISASHELPADLVPGFLAR